MWSFAVVRFLCFFMCDCAMCYEDELFLAYVAWSWKTNRQEIEHLRCLNINTLSHKHFIIGVLCYNCFTTSFHGFCLSGAKQLTLYLISFYLFAMLALPNICRSCCQFGAKPLSKLWSIYFLLADNTLRNQYGFLNQVTKYKTGCLINFLPCMAILICSSPGSLWSDSLTIFYHVYDRSSEIECKILLLVDSKLCCDSKTLEASQRVVGLSHIHARIIR